MSQFKIDVVERPFLMHRNSKYIVLVPQLETTLTSNQALRIASDKPEVMKMSLVSYMKRTRPDLRVRGKVEAGKALILWVEPRVRETVAA